jgi:hemoglobin
MIPKWAGFGRIGRGDSIAREKQLLSDYFCSVAGMPMYYTGRDMKTSHKGMKISERARAIGHMLAACWRYD